METVLFETEAGLLLKAPVDVKDSLRRYIPTATYVKAKQGWWVGFNSKRMLNKWIADNKEQLRN